MTKHIDLESFIEEEWLVDLREAAHAILSENHRRDDALAFFQNSEVYDEMHANGEHNIEFEQIQLHRGVMLLKIVHRKPASGEVNHYMGSLRHDYDDLRQKYPSGAVACLRTGEVTPYNLVFHRMHPINKRHGNP